MPPSTAKRTPRRARGEGQWALGYREPLNPNEQNKKDDDGLNVRAADHRHLLQARLRLASTRPTCAAGCAGSGLYTQRSPGIDGGKTARRSSPRSSTTSTSCCGSGSTAAQLTTEQLRAIGDISTAYARDTADVTDRQNIQLHWIRIEDVPAIWERLEAVGLSTTEACGDTPRVILGCPLAGIDADEIIDATPADRRDRTSRYIGDPAFSNLPRKFKTSISGCPAQCTRPRDQRRLVRRRAAPRRRARLRPVGRRRPVHQPDDRPAARRLRPARPGARGLGRRRRRSSATTATGGCGTGPGSSSWSPTGAPERSARCWRRSTSATRCPTARRPGRRAAASATTSACTRSATASSTSASRRASAGSTATPLDADRRPRRRGTAAAGCGPPPSRRWSSSTCPRTRSTAWSPSWRRSDLQVDAERVPAAHDGLHRASSSASSRSSRPRRAPST